jgi:hypothetical protein
LYFDVLAAALVRFHLLKITRAQLRFIDIAAADPVAPTGAA